MKPILHKKLQFFVLGHTPNIEMVSRPFLKYVNLNDLDVGEYQRNEYSESRIFQADLSQYPHEYFGFGTWNWNKKFPWVPPLEELDQLIPRLKPDVVLTPSPVIMDLSNEKLVREYYCPITEGWHLFQEVAAHMGVPLDSGREPRVFCSSFICHREVYEDFVKVFRSEMDWLIEKYGDCENLQFLAPADFNRKPGYLFEMVVLHYFSSRNDLNVVEMYQTGDSFRMDSVCGQKSFFTKTGVEIFPVSEQTVTKIYQHRS
jgi:hypothetical protein